MFVQSFVAGMTCNADSGETILERELDAESRMSHVGLNAPVGPITCATPSNRPIKRVTWANSPTSVVDGSTAVTEDEKSAFLREYEDLGDDHVLRVQIGSSLQKTTIYVPIVVMLRREIEMMKTAALNQMSAEKWSCSTLYSLWETSPSRRLGGEISLSLEPERELKDYCDVQWKPWMTSSVREFYHFGTIRVPDDCLGSDLLLALEYFGIMTSSPEAFNFETSHALGRVKIWSAYFTHRHLMAEWVVSEHRKSRGMNLILATTPSADEELNSGTILHVNGGAASIFGREAIHGAERPVFFLPSCQLIHYLFFDNESTNRVSKETPVQIRRDFCSYVGRMIDNVDASFDVERVRITKANEDDVISALRAVFRVEPKVSSESEVTTHEQHSQANNQGQSESMDTHLSFFLETVESVVPAENCFISRDSVRPEATVSQCLMLQSDLIEYYTTSNQPQHAEELPRVSSQPLMLEEESNACENIPTQEGKRMSPHLVTEAEVDTNFEPEPRPVESNSSADNPFSETLYSMPVRFINTEFGDLQSVTSALSNPKMDDTTVNSESSNYLFLKARKLGLSKIPETVKENVPDYVVSEAIYVDGNKRSSNAFPVSTPIPRGSPTDTGFRLERPSQRGGTIQGNDAGNELVKLNEDYDIFDFLHGIVESMCPAISGEDPTKEILAQRHGILNGINAPAGDLADRRKESRNLARTILKGPIETSCLDTACSAAYTPDFSGAFSKEAAISRATKLMGHSRPCQIEETGKYGESGQLQSRYDEVPDRDWRHISTEKRGQIIGQLRNIDQGISSRKMKKGSAQSEAEQRSRRTVKERDARPVDASYHQGPDSYDMGRNSVNPHRQAPTCFKTELPPRESRHRKEQQKVGIARKKSSHSGHDRQRLESSPLKTIPQDCLPRTFEEAGKKGLVL